MTSDSSSRSEEEDDGITFSSTTSDSSWRSEEEDDERLFPGLPDQIVFDLVVPKLPWNTFNVLSSVSCRWREAIQSRHVYDAKMRSHSTEKFLLLVEEEDRAENYYYISLNSMTNGSRLRLPKFPNCRKLWNGRYCRGIPSDCRCISLDGNIYVMGGRYLQSRITNDDDELVCSEVYVLDLAGQREWEQCANMPQPRYAFGCGIVDGKIYVLGGLSCAGKPVRESLVYDPKANVWSLVQPMKYERRCPQVMAVGEELFVHGGIIEPTLIRGSHDASVTAEVYHTGKDEWKFLDLFELSQAAAMFGKLYMTNPLGIYGHISDSDGTYSWARLHSILYGDKNDPKDPHVIAIQAVNDVLTKLLWWFDVSELEWKTVHRRCIGFGNKKEKVLWDALEYLWQHYQLMFPIQL